MALIITIFFILTNVIFASATIRPIIGILAQNISWYQINSTFPLNTSYIAASYVKAVESSGSRVVPIFMNQPKSYYEQILGSINGVVFPGGGCKLAPGDEHYDAITTILNIATEMNKNGTFFPVLGICLGFEAILTISNHHEDIQQRCNIRYENYPLRFLPEYEKSLQFSQVNNETLSYLKNFPVTVNHHRWCTTIQNFTRSHLQDQWNIVTTSISKNGTEFIATAEHKEYPFIAVQFHPEKVMFEWGEELNIPHDRIAIQANRYFFDLLVELSKRNDNKFKTETEERDALIYNYKPIHTPTHPPKFEQMYIF